MSTTLPHKFPPNLSLVWVAASIGPTLRSPYGRLSSKNLNADNLPHTCTAIAEANLPLRISSTLLKGAAIVFRHQYALQLSSATNTVQHLQLLLSSSSFAAFSLPMQDLTRKDTLTMPEYPGLLELMLAPHISELAPPFAPAAFEQLQVDDVERRRAAASPMMGSFMSAVDHSLLPEAVEYYMSPKPNTSFNAFDRAAAGQESPSEQLMDLDLGLDLPPMDPVLPEYPTVFPSTITPEPEGYDQFLIPDQSTVFDGQENSVQQELQQEQVLEPAQKRAKTSRKLLIDTTLEITGQVQIEQGTPGQFKRPKILAQIATRILGPLVPGLGNTSALFCTSTIKRTVLDTARMDVELGRAALMLDTSTMLGSPDLGSLIQFPQLGQFGSPLERPSVSPMSSFGSFGMHPTFQSLDTSANSPTTAPFAMVNTDLTIPEEEEFEVGGDISVEPKQIERESTQFLHHLNNVMLARNTTQLSFNDILDNTDKSKRAAAQAFYHIVALASLGEINVHQQRPFEPIHVLEK